MRIGYTTGTFSDIHPGQIEFLKTCKSMLPPGSKLIIGLVTDELAMKQKRKPCHGYTHRRTILINFPFVDSVISHNGDDKLTALKKIHFTDVFIGDEYKDTEEYEKIEEFCTVHYIPCPLSRQYSSSRLASEWSLENVQKFQIMKDGVGGLIYLFNDKPTKIIIKTIRVSHKEEENKRTSNVYNIPIPLPRNYKKVGEVQKYANLPGINAYREIDIMNFIKDFSWCTTTNITTAFVSKYNPKPHAPTNSWSHVISDKTLCKKMYFMYQHYIKYDLDTWVKKHKHNNTFLNTLQKIIYEVKRIIFEDLQDIGLVHGDIHPTNICVQFCTKNLKNQPVISKESYTKKKTENISVYLIDFGWCLHNSFHMEKVERDYFEKCLKNKWDWTHFKESMEFFYHQESWFKELKFD